MSLLDNAALLGVELRAVVHDQLELLGHEARLAAQNLLVMIASAVAIGVLVITAWLAAVGAAALALIGLGLTPGIALLAVAGLNLLLLLLPYRLIVRKREALGFPATLRTLRVQQFPDEKASP